MGDYTMSMMNEDDLRQLQANHRLYGNDPEFTDDDVEEVFFTQAELDARMEAANALTPVPFTYPAGDGMDINAHSHQAFILSRSPPANLPDVFARHNPPGYFAEDFDEDADAEDSKGEFDDMHMPTLEREPSTWPQYQRIGLPLRFPSLHLDRLGTPPRHTGPPSSFPLQPQLVEAEALINDLAWADASLNLPDVIPEPEPRLDGPGPFFGEEWDELGADR